MINSMVTFVPELTPQRIAPFVDSIEARMSAIVHLLGPGAADMVDLAKTADGRICYRQPYVTGGEWIDADHVERAKADHHFAVHRQVISDFRSALVNGRLSGYMQRPSDGGWFRLSPGYWIQHGEMDALRADVTNCDGAAGFTSDMENCAILFPEADVQAWIAKEYGNYAAASADASAVGNDNESDVEGEEGRTRIGPGTLRKWFDDVRIPAVDANPPIWEDCWEEAKRAFPHNSIPKRLLQTVRSEAAPHWRPGPGRAKTA